MAIYESNKKQLNVLYKMYVHARLLLIEDMKLNYAQTDFSALTEQIM